MMIMRFHKLIQSKLLWLIFLGVLIFTFVGLDLVRNQSSAQENYGLMQQTVARVDGRAISRQELSFTRSLVSNPQTQTATDEELNEIALERIARLTYARSLGIHIPLDAARRQYVTQFTKEDGTLDENMRVYMQSILNAQGLNEETYIGVLQEEMTLGQLERILASTTFIPPYEAERWARTQTDMFTVRYATVSPELLVETPTPTTEDIETFFAENIEAFRIREKRRASYIKLQAGDFLDKIKPVTEEDARFRYEQQPERFVKTVEPAPLTEGETPEAPVEPKTEKIPFAVVRAELTQEIAMERALAKAEEQAATWSIQLMPSRGRKASSLQDIASESGREIMTAGPFSRGERVPGISNPFGFGGEVFSLDLSDLGRVAEPITQNREVLVVVLEEIIPSRLPELSEVQPRVEAQAKRKKEKDALMALAEGLVTSLKEKTAEGTPFEEALISIGLIESEEVSFQPQDFRRGMPTLPPAVAEKINARSAGEIFGPVESRIGQVLLAQVVSREPRPADTASILPTMKNQVAASIKLQGLQQRFREQVLDPMIERVDN